jgi:hypothetical protein
MSDLIPKNTDEEMERYMEADMIRRARIPMEGNQALKFEHDPVTKRENALFPLPSGGYVKIGDRAVTPAQAAETDVLAAEREIQNDARGLIGDVIGGAGGPTMEDYEAAGFTEAEVVQFQAQEQARVLGQPGIEVPVQLTEEQMQFGEDVGAPMLTATPGSAGAPLDFEMPPSGALERLAVAIGKGLVEGTVVSPLQFVLDTFGVQEPQIVQDLDQALQLDEDASVLLEQLPKGIAQFFGPFAAVGKLLRLGRGFLPTMGQAAAADFLGFEGNEGRLTDVLLEFGLPPNAITEMLRTDPNDPEYIGRIKNAAEGALLGIPIEAVARVVSALRSGSAKELEDSLSEMQQGAQLSFRQRINNLTSDFVGAARATGRMDPDMMREIFQRGGQPRSLGAAGTGVDDAALVGRTEDFLGQAAIIRPDDVYRGEGTPRITVRETNEPFVVRGTQQSQIDDMIQSGLVRPKPGGYGASNSAQLYFGESSEALPTSIFGRPSEERFVLVGDSNKLAGTEGPIPIDQLRHVWVVRDGETVDILPEILRANREFDQAAPNATGAPRSLGERAIALSNSLAGIRQGAAQNITLAPPSQEPMVGQLAPQYRVRVEGFTPVGTGSQSFIPRKLTPNNSQTTIQRMSALAEEFPDPLSSPESYAGMMARVRNANEVPAPPTWMIENANNMEEWSSWFSGLTPDQIRAADDGLAVQNDFRSAYQGGAGPELTGQLMLWSILSRMLSAFPHESGFLELAENATPFIQRAARGEWTDADTQAWLEMVPKTIPADSPGRSATSNANAFGETFLRKMAATDENGRSALLRLHEMIADPNMSSAEIRRQYYGLAEDTGIANKILSFALLVSGRNDVVVLDRIQINRMWAGGDKVYDDIMKQFEGAQGLAQYEALERSLSPRIEELYRMAGREGGSVGRYHWESWVLSSGQVVSHPTLEAVVRAGTPDIARNMPPTSGAPVMEGRFHRWNYGVRYERMPEGGNRYVYETSTGEPFQFTKAELDAMFKDVQKRSSGVLPSDFPGVSSFEGGNIPWYQYEGVNRERLDEIIRQSGKPVTE